jgi:hypothetical protein
MESTTRRPRKERFERTCAGGFGSDDELPRITGRLTALGAPRHGVYVSFAAGLKNTELFDIGRARTRANGTTYSFVEASARPAGCVDESLSGPCRPARQRDDPEAEEAPIRLNGGAARPRWRRWR